VWRKHIIGLSEVRWVGSPGYRCRTPTCDRRVYRSAEAEGLSLKGSTYGMDVLVTVGRLRTVDHCTRAEIHAELGQRGVIISTRHVQGLYEAYFALLGCTAGQQVEAVRRQIEQNGGLVLSLDGIQRTAATCTRGHPRLRESGAYLRLPAAVLCGPARTHDADPDPHRNSPPDLRR